MGVVDSFTGANIFIKVALCLILVANFFSWIAFTTTSWGVIKVKGTISSNNNNNNINPHYGIWRICPERFESGCSTLDGTGSGWYGAFQAFAVFGFSTLTVSMVLVIFFVFWPKCQQNSVVGMASAILAVVAAVCWFIAVVMFGAKFDGDNALLDYSLNFSFALAVIAFILAAIGGILVFVRLKSVNTSTTPSA